MDSISVCSNVSEAIAETFSIPSSVRVVIPMSDGAPDAAIVTPTESSSSLCDNAIAESSKEKIGRWTDIEHTVFLEGLGKHGKQWKTIAGMIGTRTVVQVRTHAQKYFQKMERKSQAAMSSVGSIDAGECKEKVVFQKRKSLPEMLPSSNKQRVKKAPRLSLSVGPSASSVYAPDVLYVPVAPEEAPSPDIISWDTTSLSKSSSSSSGNWSTISPNNVIGEFVDLAVDKLDAYNTSDVPMETFNMQELGEDPLEWLVDLDTQNYLPESSLPAFPELADPVQEAAAQSSLVDDAVLNNMVDPIVTMQSLFLHNGEFLEDQL